MLCPKKGTDPWPVVAGKRVCPSGRGSVPVFGQRPSHRTGSDQLRTGCLSRRARPGGGGAPPCGSPRLCRQRTLRHSDPCLISARPRRLFPGLPLRGAPRPPVCWGSSLPLSEKRIPTTSRGLRPLTGPRINARNSRTVSRRAVRMAPACRGSLFLLSEKGSPPRRGSLFRPRRGSFPRRTEVSGLRTVCSALPSLTNRLHLRRKSFEGERGWSVDCAIIAAFSFPNRRTR